MTPGGDILLALVSKEHSKLMVFISPGAMKLENLQLLECKLSSNGGNIIHYVGEFTQPQ